MSNRTYVAVLFAAVAIATTSTAFAGHGFVPNNTEEGGRWHFGPSTVSREQVRSEVQAALRSGELATTGGEAMSQRPRRETSQSSKTREQVKQEAREWRANPVTANGYREVNGDHGWEYVGPQGTVSSTTREQVQQDLRAWRADPARR